MLRMKLVVCGDSYFSADTTAPGTHFTELLPSSEYINLARAGASNPWKNLDNPHVELLIFWDEFLLSRPL